MNDKNIKNDLKAELHSYMLDISKNCSLERVVVRIVISWLFVNILTIVKFKTTFVSSLYAARVSLPLYLCIIFIIFMALTLLGRYNFLKWVESYAPMVLLTIYGYYTAKYCKEPSYYIGVTVFLAVAISYAVNKLTKFYEIKFNISVVFIYIISGFLFALYVGFIGVLRYVTYRNPNFDFGLFSQMFYYMKESFLPLTTSERQEIGLMSHFRVHFSPIYYLILPFYIIFPSPITLNIMQVLIVVSGIVPVYLICSRRNLSKSAIAVFGVIYALYPAIACGTYYDLHENCFLIPLILWLFYFIEKDDWRGIIPFMLLTLMVKEDAAVYVACIGLYTVFGMRRHKKGLVIFVSSILYFFIVTLMLNKYGLGIMNNRFTNFMVKGNDGSLYDVIKNFFANPAYVVEQCFEKSKLEYIFVMLAPLGFLPIATKKVSELILFIPILLENLAPSYKYQHSIFFQYVFGAAAILVYLAIVNYSELNERARRFMASLAVCIGICFLPLYTFSKEYLFTAYRHEREEIAVLDEAMDSIPKNASVISSTFFLPHLSNRDYIYEYPYKKYADYIVLDLRFGGVKEKIIAEYLNNDYVIEDRVDKLYIILRSTNYKEKTD